MENNLNQLVKFVPNMPLATSSTAKKNVLILLSVR
jgi:hypothetical protein